MGYAGVSGLAQAPATSSITRHSGARLFGASPESITTHGAFGAGVAGTAVMDSGPARKSAHPGMTASNWLAGLNRMTEPVSASDVSHHRQ
jgi:hypothetical protein